MINRLGRGSVPRPALDPGLLARVLFFALGITTLLQPKVLHAHAGHEHAPEPEAPKTIEVAPRFYAVTDSMQGVLVFPDAEDGSSTAPVLYVTEHVTNRPVAAANLSIDVLSGTDTKIEITSGPVAGSYALLGLSAPTTTISLMADVTKGTLSDILMFDRVIVQGPNEREVLDSVTAPNLPARFAGLPLYVWYGLIAIHAILVLAATAALISYAVRRRRAHTAPTVFLLLLLPFCSSLVAHSGDDHTEPTFTSSGPLPNSGQHFVPIETQFSADIQTSEVRQQILPSAFRALGQVEIRADRRAIITPPAEGRLIHPTGTRRAIPVLGDLVKQGEILLSLEQIIPAAEKVTLTSERAQVEAELRVAEQELAVARREAGRSEQLGNVISGQELDRARADLRIAEDRVNGLRRRLQTLDSAVAGGGPGVREVPIVAPIGGYITESHAIVGEYVSPEKQLFEIINVDEVFVGADVFETDLPKVQGATQARITLEAYPNESFIGTLHSIGQEIDPRTRSAHVLFALSNPEGKLRGGMFANIEIETGGEREVLTIPKSALFSRDGVRQVFKKVGPETFMAQPVQTVEFRADFVVVEGNITPGDLVATSGLYQVRMSPVLEETR